MRRCFPACFDGRTIPFMNTKTFVVWLLLAVAPAFAQATAALPGAREVEAYFRPFIATNNFSGSVLVTREGKVVFSKSYGFADPGRRIRNRADTRFHVASMSILFTSTAVLRLIDEGKLSFETRVSEIVPGMPNGDKITIRELLAQNSGLPDANDDLPNYDDELLTSHQTPQSMVDAIKGLPPHAEPGGESTREEHSGQNLLALIIERKTGLPFVQAMKTLVFDPFGMRDSGIDDDGPIGGRVAHGLQLSGTFGLKPAARAIHWSALPGNGSAYTTVSDVSKWLAGVRRGPLLSENSRKELFGSSDGCGWDIGGPSKRLGESIYLSNGRVAGFSSILEYLSREDIAIIALTNIEHDMNPLVIPELAALLAGKPYKAFDYRPVPPALQTHPSGDFVFGPDFYRPSATLHLVSEKNGVTLYWPAGRVAPLLPIAKDKFKDRYYWNDVTVVRGKDGKPVALEYGKFLGHAFAEVTAARVDEVVRPFVQYNAFSGVVFAAKGDKVVVQKAYGMADYEFGVPNTLDTRFAIASITKRFTSVILEHLFGEKKLSPDDPLSKWVPDFPSANAITVKMLMTHHSGVRDPDKLRGTIRVNHTSAEVVDLLKSEPLGSKPGEEYSYTTANYAILAHIVERVTGESYADLVRQYVYGPAGMKDSGELTTTAVVPRLAHGYMPDPYGRGVAVCGPEDTSWKVGGGSSYSTAADLHRFVRALYGGALMPRDAALASWTLDKMFDKKATILSGAFPGAGANLVYFPDDDVTVVVLSNNYATVAATIARTVAAMMFDKPYSVPSVQLAADPFAIPDRRIEGNYRVEGHPWTFTISIREGRPIVTWTPIRQSAMLRMSEDTWFEPFDWATLQLRLAPDGSLAEGWFNYPGMTPAKVYRTS